MPNFDSKGKKVNIGDIVHLPCKVIREADTPGGPNIILETVESVNTPLGGKTTVAVTSNMIEGIDSGSGQREMPAPATSNRPAEPNRTMSNMDAKDRRAEIEKSEKHENFRHGSALNPDEKPGERVGQNREKPMPDFSQFNKDKNKESDKQDSDKQKVDASMPPSKTTPELEGHAAEAYEKQEDSTAPLMIPQAKTPEEKIYNEEHK